MADGVGIDWSLEGTPADHAGDYANAFNIGRALAAPQGANQQPSVVEPLSLQQRARAAQTNEQLGAILQSLQGLRRPDGTPDLQGRLSAARHIARQSGLMNASMISDQDVSDEGIARHAAVVRAMQRQFDNSGSPGDSPSAQVTAPLSGSAARSGGPNVGDVEGGHRFYGGDPADPHSWRKVQ